MSWASVHRQLQGSQAYKYVDGSFAFIGTPQWANEEFNVNVYSFDRARVEVLTGGERTARACCSLFFRYGAAAVYVHVDVQGGRGVPLHHFEYQGPLKRDLTDLATCDLMRLGEEPDPN